MNRRTKSLAPRVHQPPKEQVGYRLPGELLARVRATAKERGVSCNELVTRTLSRYVLREAEGSPPARPFVGGVTDAVIEGLIIQARTVEQTHKLLGEMNVGLLAELAQRKAEIAALRKDLAVAFENRTKEVKDHLADTITKLVEPEMEEIEKSGHQTSGSANPIKPSASEVQQKPKTQTQAGQRSLVNPLQGRAIPNSRSSTTPTGGNPTRR